MNTPNPEKTEQKPNIGYFVHGNQCVPMSLDGLPSAFVAHYQAMGVLRDRRVRFEWSLPVTTKNGYSLDEVIEFWMVVAEARSRGAE